MTLIAFGSTTRALADRLLTCSGTNLTKARRFARQLDADLGGTEIGAALDAAYGALRDVASGEVFLVTDGEVGDWRPVVESSRRMGHRIFTVGVGSAVTEAFVRGLAAATGGQCELVSPREGMADRVVRHFARMRAPRARRVSVVWPEGARELAPARIPAVFEGDTVVASARFDALPVAAKAVLEIESESGELVRQESTIERIAATVAPDQSSTLARLAASMRLADLSEGAARETALRYRLVSPYTNWLVVAERAEDEKALEMPALRKVPQMLQAGWGGVGSVGTARTSVRVDSAAPPMLMQLAHDIGVAQCAELPDATSGGIGPPISEACERLLQLIADDASRLGPSAAFDLLRKAGIVDELADLFTAAEAAGLETPTIASIVLVQLLDGPLAGRLPRGTEHGMSSLRHHAKRAMAAIEDLRRRAASLRRSVNSSTRNDVLRSDVVSALAEVLQRLERFDAVLDLLGQSSRRICDPLLVD